jgi:hypothetical protein
MKKIINKTNIKLLLSKEMEEHNVVELMESLVVETVATVEKEAMVDEEVVSQKESVVDEEVVTPKEPVVVRPLTWKQEEKEWNRLDKEPQTDEL